MPQIRMFVYGFSKILFEAKFPPIIKKEKFVNPWLTVS